jgi:hypothetical protein
MYTEVGKARCKDELATKLALTELLKELRHAH